MLEAIGAAIYGAWGALGEGGRVIAMLLWPVMVMGGIIALIAHGAKHAMPMPDEDAQDWGEEQEARIRAEKEQVG